MPPAISTHDFRTTAHRRRVAPVALAILAVFAGCGVAWGELLVDPTGGTALINDSKGADDEVQTGRALGFEFSFFGGADEPVTQVDVSSNGNLNFSADTSFANAALPSAVARISPLWDDLEIVPGSGDSVVEKIDPGAYYSVTWTAHQRRNLLSRHVFQVVIFGRAVRIGQLSFRANDVVFAYREIGLEFDKANATIGLDAGDAVDGEGSFATAPLLTATRGLAPSGLGAALLQLSGGMLLFRADEEEGGYLLPMLTNAPPQAVDDAAYSMPGDTGRLRVTVLPNDSDANGDTLSVLSVTPGALGAVTINADGTLNYT